MAPEDKTCNHAYGLTSVRCPECGSHVASRCENCDYESRYDHKKGCSAPGAGRKPGKPGASLSRSG